ncbi:MAG: hypothetical protein ACMXYD_03440 [Candidatus Woesearchaeota archaeon]
MKQYEQHWKQIREQLDSQGFVLLPEALNNTPTYTKEKRVVRADKHSYTQTSTPEEIRKLLEKIADKLSLEEYTISTQTFTTGDFTLQDSQEPYEGVEILYMSAPEWEELFRGEITYTPTNAQPLIVPVTNNAVAIIRRENEMRSFVKRVTHYAKTNELRISFLRSK